MAAPCCGGGSAAPALISGDDAYQLSFSVSRSKVIGDAPEHGIPVFRKQNHNEITQTYKIDGAFVFNDDYQAGMSIPIVQRNVSNASFKEEETGFGDIKANLGYEFWPELSYSEIKPRGFVFMQITVPTGKSIYETSNRVGADAMGRGFYSLGIGTLLVKKWNVWDALIIPNIYYSFTRTFEKTDETIKVKPGFGGNVLFGIGYNFLDYRVGLRITPNYNQFKRIQSSVTGETISRYQMNIDTGLDFAYLFNQVYSLSISYTDQTILGPAVNTTLSRTVALNFQKRWEK